MKMQLELTFQMHKRIADDIKAQTGKDVTVTTDENGNTVIKDDKGNVVATVDQTAT